MPAQPEGRGGDRASSPRGGPAPRARAPQCSGELSFGSWGTCQGGGTQLLLGPVGLGLLHTAPLHPAQLVPTSGPGYLLFPGRGSWLSMFPRCRGLGCRWRRQRAASSVPHDCSCCETGGDAGVHLALGCTRRGGWRSGIPHAGDPWRSARHPGGQGGRRWTDVESRASTPPQQDPGRRGQTLLEARVPAGLQPTLLGSRGAVPSHSCPRPPLASSSVAQAAQPGSGTGSLAGILLVVLWVPQTLAPDVPASGAFTSTQGSWSRGGLFLFCPSSLGLSVTEQRPLVGPAPASWSPDRIIHGDWPPLTGTEAQLRPWPQRGVARHPPPHP